MTDTHGNPLEQSGTQCLVVLQLLRDNHPARWSRQELEHELYDIDPAAIAVALERLYEHGVVQRDNQQVWASACTRHLDALGFICV